MPHKVQMVGTTAKRGRRGTERKSMKRAPKTMQIVRKPPFKREIQRTKRKTNRLSSRGGGR